LEAFLAGLIGFLIGRGIEPADAAAVVEALRTYLGYEPPLGLTGYALQDIQAGKEANAAVVVRGRAYDVVALNSILKQTQVSVLGKKGERLEVARTIESLNLIETVNLIRNITTISNIQKVAQVDMLTSIANIWSVDLIDRITLIDAITNIGTLNLLNTVNLIKSITSIDLIKQISLIDEITKAKLLTDWAAIEAQDVDVFAEAPLPNGTQTTVLSYNVPSNKTLLVFDWSSSIYGADVGVWAGLAVTSPFNWLDAAGGIRGFHVAATKPKRADAGKTVEIRAMQNSGVQQIARSHIAGALI